MPTWPLAFGAVAPFWVRGDGREPERHRPSVQAAAGSSRPVLRVLVTTVTCLSNCPGSVPLLAAPLLFLLVFPLPPFHASQPTAASPPSRAPGEGRPSLPAPLLARQPGPGALPSKGVGSVLPDASAASGC